MTYQWKTPGLYSVSAQAAGEELSRIYAETGSLEPKTVVEQSRSEDAPLHPVFEWDDTKAAEKWREQQARVVIGAIVTVREDKPSEEIRAFVHVESAYHPTEIALNNEAMTVELLASALRELKAFQRKYQNLKELAEIMAAIDQLEIA